MGRQESVHPSLLPLPLSLSLSSIDAHTCKKMVGISKTNFLPLCLTSPERSLHIAISPDALYSADCQISERGHSLWIYGLAKTFHKR